MLIMMITQICYFLLKADDANKNSMGKASYSFIVKDIFIYFILKANHKDLKS